MAYKIFGMNHIFLHYFLLTMSLSFDFLESKKVPAMFLFGDSLLDVGNNNHLRTIVRANVPPDGIDMPDGKPTGRFSNGKIVSDFLAEKVGLPSSPPPYLSLVSNKKTGRGAFRNGVNFASGGSGLLNDTGRSFGEVIPLARQVDYYASVYKELVREEGLKHANKRFSRSLFVILSGHNDIFTYASSPDLKRKSTPAGYLGSMVFTFQEQLKRLYTHGARKFVIGGLAAIGCVPSMRITNKEEKCNATVNGLCDEFNRGLKLMLQKLQTELKHMEFSYTDTYLALLDVIAKPAKYGFTEVKEACCGVGKLKAEFFCIAVPPCADRSNHVFWDQVHPSEATHRILANTAFEARPPFTYPMNVGQLVAS